MSTAAPQSERFVLPVGWGDAILQPPGVPRPEQGARSYAHGGERLWWRSPFADAACDLEHADVDVRYLASRFGIDDAEVLGRWVTAEVLAKLTRTPILWWLKRHGLPLAISGRSKHGPFQLFTGRFGPWYACFGALLGSG